jgi:voltage-gated sodium channel
LVVAVSFVPTGGSFTVLRALRIFRVLRVISTAPRLRRVVEGFITALPGMASVFLLMAIIFYIGSVIATKLFGASFPDWFGTLGLSAYSLFQIMTLESWSMGIVRPVMEVYPYAWVFFVPFIVVTTFAVVNLLVGLIVNSMQDAHHEDEHAEALAHRDELMLRLDAIEKKLDRMSK